MQASEIKQSAIGKFRDKTATIGIVGLGYVGLPLMLRYAETGFKVLGFDIDAEKVNKLNNGETYIEHITADKIAAARAAGFEATTDFSRIGEVEAVILCVPTPLNKYREPDMSFVIDTTDAVKPYLRAGQVLSLESTTYPGTTEEELLPRVEEGGLKVGENVFLVYSPEREDPGNPDFETRTIPKVIGGHTPAPPVDRDHPLWGLNASRAAESQTAGRLGGIGVLGAGALGLRGAARMGSTGMGALGRMGGGGPGSLGASGAGALGRGGAAAGASALRTGSYSGTGMGTYTPPGSGKSAGTTGQGAAASQRGGFMGASGAGAGGAKEDKKQRRRKYEAFRVEDEDEDALPRGYVNPLSQTYGTDKDIAPARRRDDGWDPNQW